MTCIDATAPVGLCCAFRWQSGDDLPVVSASGPIPSDSLRPARQTTVQPYSPRCDPGRCRPERLKRSAASPRLTFGDVAGHVVWPPRPGSRPFIHQRLNLGQRLPSFLIAPDQVAHVIADIAVTPVTSLRLGIGLQLVGERDVHGSHGWNVRVMAKFVNILAGRMATFDECPGDIRHPA